MKKMDSQKIFNFQYTRKDAAVRIEGWTTFKIEDDHVHVDPELLFQVNYMLNLFNFTVISFSNIFQK